MANSKVTTTTRELLEFLKECLVTSGVGRHDRFTTSSWTKLIRERRSLLAFFSYHFTHS